MTQAPHLPGDALCDMSLPSSTWPASLNKLLSFTSVPASQVLAFIAGGSWASVWLHRDSVIFNFYFSYYAFCDLLYLLALLYTGEPEEGSQFNQEGKTNMQLVKVEY